MADPIPAASVLLALAADSAEVYLVQRAENLRFLGGFVAFPGGKVDAEDARIAERAPGLTDRHVAVIRELFEETGVLLAHLPDGAFPPSSPALSELRRELLDNKLSFTDFLDRQQLALQPGDLRSIGSMVTPAFSTLRFDTEFFVGVRPANQEPEVWPGELSRGFWASADEALRQWNAGDLLISPPTVLWLDIVRTHSLTRLPLVQANHLSVLLNTPMPSIWFSPGVLMIPLRCDGIPPGSHTNAYLVGRDNHHYLLDPGPTETKEQEALIEMLSRTLTQGWDLSEVTTEHAFASLGKQPGFTSQTLIQQGGDLAGVILTHHHPDHIGAALRVAREWQVPILAHAVTAELLHGKIPMDRELRDGEVLDLGMAPHGKGRWSLQAFHTPGHAPGHLVFWESTYRLLFAADMISTLSSIIIAPPEGDLAQYLDSLRLLQRFPARLLLPAHGAPSARPAFLLQEALAHRETRERQLLESLVEGPRSIPEIVLELYRGLPANLTRLAELQTLAGLQKLQREQRAEFVEGATWRLRTPVP